MICPRCNTVINDNVTVCPSCGAELAGNNGYNNSDNTGYENSYNNSYNNGYNSGYNNGYNNQNPNYNVPVPPYGNNYQYQQDMIPNQPPKKSYKWVIFLIIGIVLLLMIAAVVAFFWIKGIFGGNISQNPRPPYGSDITGFSQFEHNNQNGEEENRQAEEQIRHETEVKTTDEAEEQARKEDAERKAEEARKEAEKREAEEKARREAEEREAEERAKREEEARRNKRLVIATGGLNLRSQPSTNSNSRGIIPDGSIITVNSEYDGWVYTTYDGITGWCSAEFLFVPTEYNYEILYSARVTSQAGVELIAPDHMVGSRNAKTTIPYDHVVYVYIVNGNRAFVSYNNIYGWCDTYDLQRRY